VEVAEDFKMSFKVVFKVTLGGAEEAGGTDFFGAILK
jgi:hypothetical protein